MATLVRRRTVHPGVVQLARRLQDRASGPDRRSQISTLRTWLRERLTFSPDPINVEWVDDPADQLQDLVTDGRIRGDCDDAATLGATLARAMGIPARFVVAGFGPPPAPYAHVWAEAFDGSRWYDLDVTRAPDALSPSRRSVYTLDSGELMPQLVPTARRAYDPYTSTLYPVRQGVAGYDPYQETHTLGILPAVPVAVATGAKITAWVAAFKPLANLFGSGREEDRIRLTDAAVQQAMGGNQIALLFLRQRTGDFGVVDVPGFGLIGGWGSSSARAYASRQYHATLAALGQSGPNLIDVPGVGPVGVPQGVKEAGFPVAIAAGLALLLLTGRKKNGR